MRELRFFGRYAGLTLGRLCRQRWLLAGLALLCLILPLLAGQTAGALLSRGVDFSAVTLAVTAPEGDGTPRLLEEYMGEMEDIARYCRVVSMEEGEALSALERGEVTAVLALPEHFIQGVMWGENPDLRLIVPGDRPLESLLLLWVGQSACDILSAFQAGVYAVLELYEAAPPPGLSRDQVVLDINLDYISLALNRGDLFRTRTVSAAGTLPVPLHYGLALLSAFALSAAPLFMPVYCGNWMAFQRRLRSVGRGCGTGWLSGVLAGVPILLALVLPGLLLPGEGDLLPALGAAAGMALYGSLFASLCCLGTGSAAGCGVTASGVSLAALALAGGIVPPVLMPPALRNWSRFSPVTWLIRLGAAPMGYPVPAWVWAGLGLSAMGMALLSWMLYCRRADREEGTL